MLHDHLVLFGPLLGGAEWIFSQENTYCSAQGGLKTKKLMFCQGLLKYGFNPIQNLWSTLSHRVYAYNKQFFLRTN